jgi:hypothetical protein
MAKLNRTCFTCGKKHSYCPSCYEDRELETWHIMFDKENCKTIFDIVNRSFYQHISIDEANSLLEKCDLSELDTFNDDIKKDIENILKQKNTQPAEEPVVNMENKVSYKNKK